MAGGVFSGAVAGIDHFPESLAMVRIYAFHLRFGMSLSSSRFSRQGASFGSTNVHHDWRKFRVGSVMMEKQ